MSEAPQTECGSMGRKKKPADEAPQERVEFVAPEEWVTQLDAAAAKRGMTRSAYIRNACIKQMLADAKEEKESGS